MKFDAKHALSQIFNIIELHLLQTNCPCWNKIISIIKGLHLIHVSLPIQDLNLPYIQTKYPKRWKSWHCCTIVRTKLWVGKWQQNKQTT